MQEWVKEWEIIHSTSMPYSPKSNSWAENAFQSVKNLIEGMVNAKGRLDYDAVEDAFLQRNNTPNPYTNNLAPSQILFGHRTRSTSRPLPIGTQSGPPKSSGGSRWPSIRPLSTWKSRSSPAPSSRRRRG